MFGTIAFRTIAIRTIESGLRRAGRAPAILSIALAAALFAGPAFAEENECVESCRSQAADCRFDIREDVTQCLEDSGCAELREAFRDLCQVEDRDQEICKEARMEVRTCMRPCRDLHREDVKVCRDEMKSCLEECGVEPKPRRNNHRGYGRRPGGEPTDTE
ncbi:MAG: hypothetical protein JRG96_13020 [Deltaproteobacteria bacterium]|nr:hypothetical protein [Deltaproteobacteria bacterium]MBW2420213.1 hypothetical protein [Deltaproteobacteria bacterium]